MLSRVAHMVYWMQRYRERVENVARLIDVNLYLSIDAPGDAQEQWEPLVITGGDSVLFKELYGEATEQNVIEFLTFDERNKNSILHCLRESRDNARAIRQVITSEMWNELNQLYLYIYKTAGSKGKITSPYEFFQKIRSTCQLFTGITDTTMSHNAAWHFGRIGYLLERADQTTRILDVKYFILLPSPQHVGSPYDDIQWAALLKSISGFEMYMKKWNDIRHASVVEFMLLDPYFPRSVFSCVRRTLDSLRAISALSEQGSAYQSKPEQLLETLCSELAQMKVYEVIKTGLHEFIDNLQMRIIEIHNSLYRTFFSPNAYEMIYQDHQAELKLTE
ncbi:MAG: alpha-E domain-containing protein [Candidatus Omnitrophica bacterium]|nr:alpha-E domain-containing protein [Candidatus Omnitrophota bacterium]